MEKEMSKIEKIKKSLLEMESYLTDSDVDNGSREKIAQVADKGRSYIDKAEKKANEMATKIKEKIDSHKHHGDEQKNEKMKKCFITILIALIAIMSFKKMKKNS